VHAVCERFYTVAKANEKEALIWKIAVLGRKKPPVNAETFGSLAHAGILHSSKSEMSSAHGGMSEDGSFSCATCYIGALFWLSRFRRVMKFHEGSLDALVYLPQEKLGNPVKKYIVI
jgi:hypothetical protein